MTTQSIRNAEAATDDEWKAHCDAYNKKVGLLRAEREKIDKSFEELSLRQQELAKNHGGSDADDNDRLEINVGGVPITVNRGTLTQIKGTRLEALFSGRWEDKLLRDSDGRIFLDVNPTCFQSIVDYLNERRISPQDDLPGPPYVDKENQMYLDQLMEMFGLVDESSLKLDTEILNDPKHVQALYDFLSEDEINGNFELIYRGSRDGFLASDFHSKCDNQGPTVTVVRDSNGHMFGGYAGTPWQKKGSYKRSEEAFLFALHCHAGLEPTKMRIKPNQAQHAIFHNELYGPTFGGGHDLYVHDRCNEHNNSYTNGSTYEVPQGQNSQTFLTGNRYFQVSEIEVFKISDSNKRNKLNPVAYRGHSQAAEEWQSITFDEFPEKLKNSLLKEQSEIQVAKEELKKFQLAFEKEKVFIEYFASTNCDGNGRDMDIISFNVSGKLMQTKRSTVGVFEDSVLAKHFNDPLWKSASKDDNTDKDSISNDENEEKKVCGWDSSDIQTWISSIDGLSDDDVTILKVQVINGIELLALEPSFLKDMGITRVATQAIIMKSIKELRKVDDGSAAASNNNNDNTMTIDHSSYCFGRILDHLRLHAFYGMSQQQQQQQNDSNNNSQGEGDEEEEEENQDQKYKSYPVLLPLPIVRECDRKRFQRIVYYFPCDSSPFVL